MTIFLILQLLSALKYMHSKKIVHGDIKLENCLLQKGHKKSEWKVILCDFGMSCHFDDKHPYRNDTTDNRINSSKRSRSESGEETSLVKYPTTNFLPDEPRNDFDVNEDLKYQFKNRKYQPLHPKKMASSSSYSLKCLLTHHLHHPPTCFTSRPLSHSHNTDTRFMGDTILQFFRIWGPSPPSILDPYLTLLQSF